MRTLSRPVSNKVGALSQLARIIILAIYLFLLFLASRIAFGSWLPPTSSKGLWFYAGLPLLILGNLVISPFFTKPADAIAYATTGLISALGIGFIFSTKLDSLGFYFGLGVAIYLAFIIISGIAAIAGKDSRYQVVKKISSSFYTICDIGGGAKPIFSAIFLFAMIAFHRFNFQEWITIGVAWAIIVVFRPLESLFRFGSRLVSIWKKHISTEMVGEVVAYMYPNLILIKRNLEVDLKFGEPVAVRSTEGNLHIGIALNNLRMAGESRVKILEVPKGKLPDGFSENIEKMPIEPDEAVKLEKTPFFGLLSLDELVGKLIGLVTVGTNIDKLEFELVREDQDIEKGRLVRTCVGKEEVLYQILDGLTKEEAIQQKNTYGYIRVSAKKIGTWKEDKQQFKHIGWIPKLNEPVYLVETLTAEPAKEAIGFFPGTDYPVFIKNIHDLVTHNCAILGILGIGKTYLSFELVERILKEKIKVITLDLTDEYEKELAPHYNVQEESNAIKKLKEIEKIEKKAQQNIEEGGNIVAFQNAVEEDLRRFLNKSSQDRLKIYNPAYFEIWRQTGGRYKDSAAMTSLTPTGITQIIVEKTLKILQQQGTTKEARVCIVFEEAHSLIPEWNSVAVEGDKNATNGTARAILQGRKYGLGCLLVTQRTANVTKSILNQCNTVFALRVFDATGMDFLKNYIGEDYAGVLSTLQDRHAVVFGKASSCSDPVLVRLNDRYKEFLPIFRPATKRKTK